MQQRKIILHETLVIAVGTAICTGAMLGIYWAIGRLNRSVMLGALVGTLLTLANFFIMALTASLAADKAGEQDSAAGKKIVQSSYFFRLLALFCILFACAKSGLFDPLAMVIPLAFVRPVVTVYELVRKKGAEKA